MVGPDLNHMDEDQMDMRVSHAIREAEILEDQNSPAARDAWREVLKYESRLAEICPAIDLPGGIARAGAVSAAIAAGEPTQAHQLAARYLAEDSLPQERRDMILSLLSAHETLEY